MRQTMRAIWCATLVVCALLAVPSAIAQTLHADNQEADCSSSKCRVSFSFSAAVRLERVACLFETRAPAGKTPKLARVVLRRMTGVNGTETARQVLPFTNTYDNGSRQSFVVATNPLFNVAAPEIAEVSVLASPDTNLIKIECYAAGFPQ